jgi:signal transduction histidine kinase
MIPSCDTTRPCPISKAPCPGVCVYANIFENIDLGIIVFDLVQKSVVFYNPAAGQLFKPTVDPGDFEILSNLLFPGSGEEIFLDACGKCQPIQHNDMILGYSVYPISGNRFLWVFVRDITDKLRLDTLTEAVNAMDNIGYVFSGIRHEIGNPINSAKMALSVLKENFDDFPKEMALEFVNRSLDELQRVEFLLKSLRNINLFETPDLENTDLPDFLDHFISLVWKDFSKKGIRINTEFLPEAKWALVDPRPLQQVLLNVFTNAADALENRCDPTIVVSTARTKGFVWLKVTDNGCGITPKNLKEIFKPFFTTKPHGTGLGLVICRKMLARMNCMIEIESSKNIGTTVSISLPEGRGENA